MTKITVSTNAHTIFGSGSASVRLVADGKRVEGALDGGSNGFVGWVATPLASLRDAKRVEFREAYSPGSTNEFEGSGRAFVKWAIRQGVADGLPSATRRTEISRGDRLSAMKVARIQKEILKANPEIAGGGKVPRHFYTAEGRWEECGEVPHVNQDGLSSWMTVVIQNDGTWFRAPGRVTRRVLEEVRAAMS